MTEEFRIGHTAGSVESVHLEVRGPLCARSAQSFILPRIGGR